MKMKTLLAIRLLALLTALLLALSACGETAPPAEEEAAGNTGSEAVVSEPAAETLAYDAGDLYAQEDLDDSWDAAGATSITLQGNSAQIAGVGASAEGGAVTIFQAGTYVLSGNLEEGQIRIEAGKEDLVRLVLNGVSLQNSSTAPICAVKAGKTVLILAEGTENTVTDGADYIYGEDEDEPDAAIFAKDDLSITGTGSLTVTGQYHNGIGSKDHLRITGGTISVTAANDGLRGRDSVAILDGVFTIRAENDGVKSNNSDEDKGYIVLDGGIYDIQTGHDGVQAESSLTVNGGTYSIVTGGGSENAPQRRQSPGRGWGGREQEAEDTEDATESESDSRKALKAGTLVTVTGGTFHIDAADDAVHSNGGLYVQGGVFTISTGDDGFHADDALVIDDGTIDILTSYEGLEGATVDINGGDITLKASDDGVNAAGGADSGFFGGPGDSFADREGYYIRITGGTLRVEASGDGLDSNGNLTIDGGTVLIDGPTSNGDAPIDADGAIEINGGAVIAVGSSGMFEVPRDSSHQHTLAVYFSAVQEAGGHLELRDGDGNALAEFTAAKSYQAVLFSNPDLAQGETYSLYLDDAQVVEITLESVVTRISEDGSQVTGGFGGGMGGGRPGGGRGEGGFPPEGGGPGEGGTPPEGGPGGGGGRGGPQGDAPGDPPEGMEPPGAGEQE